MDALYFWSGKTFVPNGSALESDNCLHSRVTGTRVGLLTTYGVSVAPGSSVAGALMVELRSKGDVGDIVPVQFKVCNHGPAREGTSDFSVM